MLSDKELGELAVFLGLNPYEVGRLMASITPQQLERYQAFSRMTWTPEQLLTVYNRPPPADDDSDISLGYARAAALTRMESHTQSAMDFRSRRSGGSVRGSNGQDEGLRRFVNSSSSALDEDE